MVLTTEERIQLKAKARAAKANKKVIIEEEPEPEPEPEPIKKKTGRKPKEVVPLPEPVQVVNIPEEPAPAPKKKSLPAKWLKNPKIEAEKCCDEIVSKEEPLITDEKPQLVAEKIVVPSKSTIKKPKAIRASTPARTLDIVEKPKEIEEVMEEVVNNDMKYRPPQKRQQAPAQQAPVSIRHQDPPLQLFSY